MNKCQDKEQFKVIDPWNDPFCEKNGLASMYIESSIAEILGLSAELEPGVKLNCPNPVYTKYHALMVDCLEKKDKNKKAIPPDERRKRYLALVDFLNDVNIRQGCGEIKIAHWEDKSLMPDIRVAQSIGEALGWLGYYMGLMS